MTQTSAAEPKSRPTFAPTRLTPMGRLVAAVVAVACLTVLIVASRVVPQSTGMGTHTQIGLQPCGFLRMTGLPCGTCGMTTSFAYFVRGNLVASAYVQPLGAVVALLTGIGFWAAGHAASTGRPAYRVLRRVPVGRAVAVGLTLFLLAWGWKIGLVVGGVDGW
jgi:hypothetical protein